MSGGLSGVILAGGASRRMGRDKALLDVDGRPLIAVVAERLRSVVDELVIASGDNEAYAQYADRCVADIFPGVGTLGGLHAGLDAAAHDRVLVVGCDMPFLNPSMPPIAKAACRPLRRSSELESDKPMHSMTGSRSAMWIQSRLSTWIHNYAPSLMSTHPLSGSESRVRDRFAANETRHAYRVEIVKRLAV
jgi:molybdopterin-guanine dinucleotide biosynthesis protein A